jgi:hypothetical protein
MSDAPCCGRDSWTTYKVLFVQGFCSSQYKIPFAVFGVLSIISGFFSMAYRVRHAQQFRSEIQTALLRRKSSLARFAGVGEAPDEEELSFAQNLS